jgi:hypothetical protein
MQAAMNASIAASAATPLAAPWRTKRERTARSANSRNPARARWRFGDTPATLRPDPDPGNVRVARHRRHAYGELLAWFTRLLASDAFMAVALDGRAALVTGRLRGVLPQPPSSRRDRRSKTMRQASRRLDIQIAAPALDVVDGPPTGTSTS